MIPASTGPSPTATTNPAAPQPTAPGPIGGGPAPFTHHKPRGLTITDDYNVSWDLNGYDNYVVRISKLKDDGTVERTVESWEPRRGIHFIGLRSQPIWNELLPGKYRIEVFGRKVGHTPEHSDPAVEEFTVEKEIVTKDRGWRITSILLMIAVLALGGCITYEKYRDGKHPNQDKEDSSQDGPETRETWPSAVPVTPTHEESSSSTELDDLKAQVRQMRERLRTIAPSSTNSVDTQSNVMRNYTQSGDINIHWNTR